MLQHLILALLASAVVAVVPGYFWAASLCGGGLASRLTFSIGVSITLVPAIALIPARFFGFGVTLPAAIFSVLFVLASGLAVYLKSGAAKDPQEPIASPPAPFGPLALILVLALLGLVLVVLFEIIPEEQAMVPLLILALFTGSAYLMEGGNATPVEPSAVPPESRWRFLRGLVLPVVLALVLARGYLGPALHDWPYLRGTDQFNHGVMANEMLSSGAYESYLVYPPGFHTVIACISRLSGLRPLEIFPVLAPAFLILPCLAVYALANRLWGWGYAVTAAAFAGLLLNSTYSNFAEARYPNFVSAEFLMVLAVAALAGLYAAPSIRTGLAFALLGSSVVLVHPVGSLYMALLLALVSVLLLPYLLLYQRRLGITLLLSLALLGGISVLYAWDTYDLGRLLNGLISGKGQGAGGAAVSQAIGTQEPLPLAHLTQSLSHPVLWLGAIGAVMLLAGRSGRGLPAALSRVTLLLWGGILFVGSRTAMSGFPERFERDLGVPLALFAALAGVTALRSLRRRQSLAAWARPVTVVATAAVAVALALAVGVQGERNLRSAAEATPQALMTPDLAAAGEWLRKHNDGGSIVAPAYIDRIPVRAVLAMGGYTELQTYRVERIRLARSLPPTGAQPLWDGRWLLHHPDGERTHNIIEKYDIRYIVLHKPDQTIDWRAFVEKKDLYRVVYENEKEIIVAPRDSS